MLRVILGVSGLLASFAWSDDVCCAHAADERNTPNRASDAPDRMRHDPATIETGSIGPRANARKACPKFKCTANVQLRRVSARWQVWPVCPLACRAWIALRR